MEGARSISFLDFRIDPVAGELSRGGERVAVEPQVLDLIAYLAAHPQSLVTKDELIEHVWGGRIVSDSAIASRINAARTALGDDGSAQRLIKTIPRRGFRFEAETRSPASEGPALPEKPSVAILPFQNLSGDPEQTYFSDGITDDIITDLSRYDELFVIARHSSFAYRDASAPLVEIARELGVQYIAEGSVRRFGDRVRVTARLVDPHDGNEVWAERYDREVTDIFDVQDEISGVIVNTLAGRITKQHYQRTQARGAAAVAAYDHVLRALVHYQRFLPEDNAVARREAETAIAIDPSNAMAHALLAWSFNIRGALRLTDDPVSSYRQARDSAAQAVALDDGNAWGQAALGFAETWGMKNHGRGLGAMEKAVALSPNNAMFRGWLSQALCFVGRAEDGLEEVDLAMRLNPHYPPIYSHWKARVLYTLGRLEEALRLIEIAVNELPTNPNTQCLTAACLSAVGQPEKARQAMRAALAISPSLNSSNIAHSTPYQGREEMERYVGLLVAVGLPEGPAHS
jgi:TolB-like protein/tetratricopeptide (TPR) repeat protein